MFAKLQDIEKEMEARYTPLFVAALKNDRKSAKHGAPTNHVIIDRLINLIQNRTICPELSLEKIIRGGLNLAVLSEDNKYNILRPSTIGDLKYHYFMNQQRLWFMNDSNNASSSRINTAALVEASKGPLFMMSACLPETLVLYSEFMGEYIGEKIKNIPTGNSHFYIKSNPGPGEQFHFEVVDSANHPLDIPNNDRVATIQLQRKKIESLIKDLSDKIIFLEKNEEIDTDLRDSLKTLVSNLNFCKDSYLFKLFYDNESEGSAKMQFVRESIELIDCVKQFCENQMGLVDYFNNMLISLGKVVFIKNINEVTGSHFKFFDPKKAPMVAELEQLHRDIIAKL